MELDRELFFASTLIRNAGQMALDLRNNLSITNKPNGEGPVTNADLAIDQYIIQEISKEFPHDNIITEESYRGDPPVIQHGRTWFVDPIDGTISYITKASDFVIMIGLAIDGIPRLGVVFQPTTNSLWQGVNNPLLAAAGAKKIIDGTTQDLKLKLKTKPPSNLSLIASRTHVSNRQNALIRDLKPTRVHFQSSIGLKAMLILDGFADFYVAWSKHIKLWDTCAPAAIILAANAHISYIDGHQLNYMGPINHNRPLMVANFKPDDNLIKMLLNIATIDN